MDKVYRIFINGKFFNGSDNYDYAMNRALGIAMYKGLDFVNTKTKQIIDKWVGEGQLIIITKNVI